MKKPFVWRPSNKHIKNAQLTKFMEYVNRARKLGLKNYNDLYGFSIQDKSAFWSDVWDFTNIIGKKGPIVVCNEHSFWDVRWFPEATLNYAQNLLHDCADDIAIVSNAEHRLHQMLTYRELYEQVSKLVQFYKKCGLQKGDQVALFVNNDAQTVVCVLAAAAVGAICSLCSPDFGAQGIIERFSQIEPKIFIYSEISYYNGKIFVHDEKIKDVLKAVSSIEHVICIPCCDTPSLQQNSDTFSLQNGDVKNVTLFSVILKKYLPQAIQFEQVSFSHPLYIVYSSGTTGAPKCIVHSHGGVLIQHKKEHILHCNIQPGDKVFYYTTCGWMMWQWLISVLSVRATAILYQGSPFYPDHDALLKYLNDQNVTFFGTSAKYIDTLRKANLSVKSKFPFRSLKTIGSTGSPLIPENFDYVYKHWKKDVSVASLSGGTDILSCFVLGCPIKPVIAGEIQCVGLGMHVDVYNEAGQSVRGTPGELVCLSPFPSMPVFFWNDFNKIKYKKSYFKHYNNVWSHGDWAMLTSDGGCVIYGRSDATLNPAGVRIGTSEIYRQVERFNEIMESVVVEYYTQGDSYIVLFVKLQNSCDLTQTLIHAIKENIKINCSPRHVPALILPVLDIPRTKSGKLMELAVKNIINNQQVNHLESIQNPESLKYFQNIIPNIF